MKQSLKQYWVKIKLCPWYFGIFLIPVVVSVPIFLYQGEIIEALLSSVVVDLFIQENWYRRKYQELLNKQITQPLKDVYGEDKNK